MRIIFAEYNQHRNSIDVYTSAGYMLRINCREAEKDLKTTPGLDCALTSLAVDEPLEYARLYLDGNYCVQIFTYSPNQAEFPQTSYKNHRSFRFLVHREESG